MSKPKYLVYDASSWYDGASECDSLKEALEEFDEKCSKASYSDDPQQEFVMVALVIKCLSVAEICGLSDKDVERLKQENLQWWEDHFVETECPVCGSVVSYMKPDELEEGHIMMVPCPGRDNILHVINEDGKLKEKFRVSNKV